MTKDRSLILATAHHETVRMAFCNAFGHDRIDKISLLGGGASGAFPFLIESTGHRYLVRVEGPASPLRNPQQYESMRIAAEAGISPRIHYIDETARVAVMDFIEERPLSTFPGGPQSLAQAVGELLRRVQTTPTFPHFVEYPDIVGRLWGWVCQTGLFAPDVLYMHSEHFQHVRDTYAWNPANSISSHNDPVPRNILFDGKRLWLIDWESAYRNDPFVDVAIALDNFAPTPELELTLMRAWNSHDPEILSNPRLAQVRALTRLYYTGVFLSASAAVFGPLGHRDLTAPTVPEFKHAIRRGHIKPGTPSTKHILGKMYLRSFLTGEKPPGLDAAV